MSQPELPTGQHLLVDIYTRSSLLQDAASLEQVFHRAIAATGATLISYRAHQFDGGGLTAVAMLSESHMSAHTWPELGYAAFDLFTCGQCHPRAAVKVLREVYAPDSIDIREIPRGAGRLAD